MRFNRAVRVSALILIPVAICSGCSGVGRRFIVSQRTYVEGVGSVFAEYDLFVPPGNHAMLESVWTHELLGGARWEPLEPGHYTLTVAVDRPSGATIVGMGVLVDRDNQGFGHGPYSSIQSAEDFGLSTLPLFDFESVLANEVALEQDRPVVLLRGTAVAQDATAAVEAEGNFEIKLLDVRPE